MLSVRHFARFFALACLSSATLALAVPGEAAERRAVVTEDADYFGEDIETLKGVELGDCEAACFGDDRCVAFTYNTKAKWCFKKGTIGDLRTFAGAVAGRIVTSEAVDPSVADARRDELGFIGQSFIDEARKLEGAIADEPAEGNLDRLLADSDKAIDAGDNLKAAGDLRKAVRLDPDRNDLWWRYSDQAILVPADNDKHDTFVRESTAAAVNAYLRASDVDEQVAALNSLANSFVTRDNWNLGIKTLRRRLALQDDPDWRSAFDDWIAQHGFRVTDNSVDTQSSTPRLCVAFSDPIARNDPSVTGYVAVEGGDRLEIEAEDNQICATGVEYGNRYHVTVRKGLPAKDGEEALNKTVELDVYVRDRDPSVRFVGKAYVLPKTPNATIPVVSVNVDTLDARVLKVGDRNLVNAVGEDRFLSQLDKWSADAVADREGREVWSGRIAIKRDTNREVTTAVPVSELVKTLEPGVYALVVRDVNKKDEWSADATQWFVVSDLGLAAMTGNDGLHVVIHALSDARAVAGVELKLIAADNDVLGSATTDDQGYARFDAGLVKGTGGAAAQLLLATKDGDFAFLNLQKAAFDLTDRGVEGRDPPRPVDVFMTTERGVYRPGETVNLTVLARDPTASALPDLPLTLVVRRPDGNEFVRRVAADEGAGGRDLSFGLPGEAQRGTWRAAAYTDPKAGALQEVTFKVEDFQPERIDFAVKTDATLLHAGESVDATLHADWLYGAPAAGLAIEGEVYVTPAADIASAPGYRFGLADDDFTSAAEDVQSDGTDDGGDATVTLVTPEVADTTRPLQAAVHVRVLDTNGRPVERRMTLPVSTGHQRIGVRPLFDGSVEEGGNAAFDVAVLDADYAKIGAKDLSWTLSRVQTNYQWYQSDGSWDYHAIKTTTRVADGKLNVEPGQPARIEARVEWGEYQLSVTSADGAVIPVSTGFQAGWYVPVKSEETPDLLKITLDKPRYAIGDTIKAHIEPRYAGVAVVSVVDDRLIAMKTLEVPAGGSTIELPVTADWGPGAYVTASLLRPLDLAEKRMPSRALGLAWAGVDPGERLLGVAIDAPMDMRPQTDLAVAVKVDGVKAGEDAYVTIAAVDVGILNLTEFKAPAPEDWYFAQRRLGIEFRDLYGQLIDTTLGALGEVRTGGDGGGISRLMGPPPTERLVAFFQGVTKVGADGFAHASFKMPDFNGTVKVMAVAWSKTGVGHAARDVLVRDPVVIQASLPNFLAPGDRSRLALDFTHVEGPAGDFSLEVTAAGDLVGLDGTLAKATVSLSDKGKARVLIPITGKAVGDETITAALKAPDGTLLTKTLTLGVRDNEPAVTRVSDFSLRPESGELRLSADLFADLKPATGIATLTVGTVAGIDLPGLVHALDKYPYGCSEQITSRALPLVYLDDVILAAGLAGEAPVRERVQKAIDALLVNQGSDGSFGLWGPGSEDLWLNAYVTDFLTRAKEKGYTVPPVAYDMAVTNLKNRIAYASDFTDGGEDVAYALYVLARNGRASIGDLRFYAETKLDAFATPLARAQLGAALALYGDGQKAAGAFRSSLDLLDEGKDSGRLWRADYGSDLRDGAAILALASESKLSTFDYQGLSREVGKLYKASTTTSTQEQAWMLLAAHAMLKDGMKPELDIGGTPHDGVFTAKYQPGDIANGLAIRNTGKAAVDARVTVTGIPETPEPAGGNGYELTRTYYDLDGNGIDPSAVKLGDRMVVVLSVTTSQSGWARLLLNDPLPAGFAIDNPSLVRAGDVAALDWLAPLDNAAHTEYQTDRFTVAFDLKDTTEFQFAYMVRAIAPGSFNLPAATLEDMYRPERQARTGAGHVEVIGPLQ
ncbi:Large extracellular alpha-helical protein [uncultured Pleomorphomonas sp.]|uniref:Large extracellular alpha-helical protein n=1 Tax=uncultured Pleomorphomonas sp. TaxID=442121 RepID=A0A212KZK8_9HYPH|nr:alpha-2-macroglobulin family protein [uncultured Pleomorphomonas sp.]SCM70754.1 Large extracellular alpha-helical protein [uncultured Pleomorphomonas sp.]